MNGNYFYSLYARFRGGASSATILIVIALWGSAWLVGWIFAVKEPEGIDLLRWGMTFALGMVALAAVAMGQRGITWGFYLWILTFILGYRTLHFTANLEIHPSEVLIWFIYVLLLFNDSQNHEAVGWPLPLWGTLFLVFAVVGIVTALANGISWDLALGEFKNFLVAIPIFGVLRHVLRDTRHRDHSLALLVAVNFYIALLGVTEYLFPSFTDSLSPYFTPNQTDISLEGVVRAGYSFWGNPIVAASLTTALPFILAIWGFSKSQRLRIILALGFGLQLFGIYITGFRSLWLTMAFVVVLYFLTKRTRGSILGLVASVGTMAAFLVLGPEAAVERLLLFLNIPNAIPDSSAFRRILYAEGALDRIQMSPLTGGGWGASGWVHNDLLQIGANLGAIALAVFCFWLGFTLLKLWQAASQAGDDVATKDWAHALMVSLIGYVMVMVSGDVIALIHTAIPFWFVLAMSQSVIEGAPEEASRHPTIWSGVMIQQPVSSESSSPSEAVAG